MTNAPVKDVGSLMNYVGSSRVVTKNGMDQTGNFGDVMNRASGNGAEQVKAQDVKEQTPKADSLEHSKVMKKDSSVVKAEQPKEVETAKAEEAVREAGEEAVEAVAEELGVSEEEVIAAMEEMGLTLSALFDPSALTQLVLKLAGGEEPMMLLTDEGLFAKLQNLTDAMGSIQNNLMQELGVNPEELQALLQEVQVKGNTSEVGIATELQNADIEAQPEVAEESKPEITVEVEVNGETVKVSADENGNLVKNLTVNADGAQQTQEEAGKQGEAKGEQNGNFHTGNPILDSLLQNKVQTAEVSFEQTTFFNPNTQEIMDQIMDYMKIQLKPGMDQLQMQLHPASLGTVQVQLTSKGGEITAQFQVQNENVKAAIESQVVELKETLREQGIKVEAVEVTVESNGFESNLWQGNDREENGAFQGSKKSPRRIDLTNLDVLFEEEATPEEVLAAKMMEANGNTVDYTA